MGACCVSANEQPKTSPGGLTPIKKDVEADVQEEQPEQFIIEKGRDASVKKSGAPTSGLKVPEAETQETEVVPSQTIETKDTMEQKLEIGEFYRTQLKDVLKYNICNYDDVSFEFLESMKAVHQNLTNALVSGEVTVDGPTNTTLDEPKGNLAELNKMVWQ